MRAARTGSRFVIVLGVASLSLACFVTTALDGFSGGTDAADGAPGVDGAAGESLPGVDATLVGSRDVSAELPVNPEEPDAAQPEGDSESPALVGFALAADLNDELKGGLAEVFGYTALATGTATRAYAWVRSGSTVSTFHVGVYSDVGGKASALLAEATFSSPSAGGWNSAELSLGTPIVKGTRYWLGLHVPSGNTKLFFIATANGTGSFLHDNESLAAVPTTWTNGQSFVNSPASLYLGR
jgi:hypothetical protein